jgi:parvulin-like peptidyl-prolyl isomerase
MLPGEVTGSSRTDVARQFGEEFADAILKVEPGRWIGPLSSGYGLHLVFVRERKDGRSPGLAEVRPVVEREFLSDRRKRQLNAMYEQMLARYKVTVEPRAAAPRAAEQPAGAPAPGGSK